jgi:hypothetical protein
MSADDADGPDSLTTRVNSLARDNFALSQKPFPTNRNTIHPGGSR